MLECSKTPSLLHAVRWCERRQPRHLIPTGQTTRDGVYNRRYYAVNYLASRGTPLADRTSLVRQLGPPVDDIGDTELARPGTPLLQTSATYTSVRRAPQTL